MNISKSIRQLALIFFMLFLGLSTGLIYWQMVVASQVTANTYLTYTRKCTSDAAPMRGKIFDRNGVLLAYSVKSSIPGLCGYKRVYTDAAKGLENVIGYYISPNFTSTGVEAAYNSFLSGSSTANSLDITMSKLLHIPPQGSDIYLTVDSKIEAILVKNFATQSPRDNASTIYATDRGSIIVSDPKTGEILGMLSEPTYDDNCVVNCQFADTLYRYVGQEIYHDDGLPW